MNRSRSGHCGSLALTRSTPPYSTATMSAIERPEATWELRPLLVISTTWRRIRAASSSDVTSRFLRVEGLHNFDNVLNFFVRQFRVQRQRAHLPAQRLGFWKTTVFEIQGRVPVIRLSELCQHFD